MQLRAWAAYAASGRYRQLSTRAMKENVAQLPSVADVKRIRASGGALGTSPSGCPSVCSSYWPFRPAQIPELDWSIENKPGKAASVAIYHAIGLRHGGRLDATGAREALLWCGLRASIADVQGLK